VLINIISNLITFGIDPPVVMGTKTTKSTKNSRTRLKVGLIPNPNHETRKTIIMT
jgi:hypothetical protein